MTAHDPAKAPPAPVALPLTEPGSDASALIISEADIRAVVDSFYETVRGDELIGPIFEERVRDWSAHLPRMYDFWSTVVLRTGRYSGRPIEVHQAIGGLTPAHFERWLTLWESTVWREIAPQAREVFVLIARRMAASMAARLN